MRESVAFVAMQINRPRPILIAAIFAAAVAFQCDAKSTFAVLTSSQAGIVYAFGNNIDGQTGTNTVSAHLLTALPIVRTNIGSHAISQAAAGNGHSLVLSDDNRVFSFGWNADGQSGYGNYTEQHIATPINATNLIGKTIAHLAGGATHSLPSTDDGTVFAFGSNEHGQTGIGITTGDTLIATPINMTNFGGRKVPQMSASEYYSLLLMDDGTVFSFGDNTSGRTGQGTSVGNTLIATPIDTSNLAGRTVTQISAGGNIPDGFSLLVTSDGTAFAFGSNANGKTGFGTASGNTLIATPIDTSNLGGKKIKEVAAAPYHSLLLAEDGTVFSFGSNDFGRTGLGTTVGDTLIPTPINMTNLGGRNVVEIAAGIYSSYLLADDGTVFSFGYNAVGGRGISSGNTLIATPIDMAPFVGFRVSEISASANGHVLLLAVPEPLFLNVWLGLVIGATTVAHRGRLSRR